MGEVIPWGQLGTVSIFSSSLVRIEVLVISRRAGGLRLEIPGFNRYVTAPGDLIRMGRGAPQGCSHFAPKRPVSSLIGDEPQSHVGLASTISRQDRGP